MSKKEPNKVQGIIWDDVNKYLWLSGGNWYFFNGHLNKTSGYALCPGDTRIIPKELM